MAPTTDSTDQAVGEFYDALADDYDQMTSFEARLDAERPLIRRIVERYALTSAVDAGAGSGFHSVVLAQLGLRVTAVDLSARMLGALASHAAARQLSVAALQSSFIDLPAHLHGAVDAVFCMGNTLAHILERHDLADSLAAFGRVLKAQGTLIVQIVNFDRILRERQRIQSVREVGDATYVRFYDFGEDRVVFNVVTLDRRTPGNPQHQVSIPLRPWRLAALTTALTDAGFRDIASYGNIALEPFDPASSKDLVIIAHGPS